MRSYFHNPGNSLKINDKHLIDCPETLDFIRDLLKLHLAIYVEDYKFKYLVENYRTGFY